MFPMFFQRSLAVVQSLVVLLFMSLSLAYQHMMSVHACMVSSQLHVNQDTLQETQTNNDLENGTWSSGSQLPLPEVVYTSKTVNTTPVNSPDSPVKADCKNNTEPNSKILYVGKLKHRFRHSGAKKYAELVESEVRSVIEAQRVVPADPDIGDIDENTRLKHRKRQHKGGRKRCHTKVEKKKKKYLSRMLKRYSKRCENDNAAESDKLNKHCGHLLQKIKTETMRCASRKSRSLLSPQFLCWTITPFHISWYDPREHLCCNGLHKRITGKEICCGNTVYNYTEGIECCRFNMYNTRTHICCDGVLYDHSTNTSDCCGQFMYDTSTTAGCCRKKLYDSQRQFCCTNKIYNKIGRQNNHVDCCGTEKYDTRCYRCNQTSSIPTIYPVFDTESQLCCSGRIKTVKSNKSVCCGRQLINEASEMCVNDRLIVPFNKSEIVLTTMATRHTIPTSKRLHTVYGITDKTKETEYEETMPDVTRETAPYRWTIIIGGTIGLLIFIPCVVMIVLRSRKKRTCKLKLSKSEKLPDDYMSSSLTQEVSRIYPLFNTSLESFDDEKFDLSYQLSTVPMFKLNLELCDTKSSCLSYHSEPTITTKLESCDTESSYLSNQPSKELIVSRNLESCDTESQPSIEQTVSRNLESCDTESSYASHQPSIEQTISRNLESCDTENSYFSNQLSMEPLISRTINSFDNNEYSVDSIQRSSSPTLHTYKTDRKFEQFPNLHKSFEYTSKNITTELFVNHGTQTLELKPCNMTDIFGQRYQYSCCLGRNNRTLTWERSDCKLTLPSSAVEEHNVEVHTSTFDDIPAICEKMSLSTDTRISSPVVEYRLTDSEKLDDFALVQIPYVGEMKEIEIWKCPSDSGMHQKLERVKVPVLEKENNEYDCFCVLENGRARVYTKSFSVFFCTKHQTERNDFCLQAFLFGSFKKILDKYEVTLSLYIADELHKFTDYNQRMFNNETRAERDLKIDKELNLQEYLTSEDFLTLKMAMSGQHKEIWTHKRHPDEDRLCEEATKEVLLQQVTRCCNSSRPLPFHKFWYLENKEGTNPKETVQCLVDICCTSRNSDGDYAQLHTPSLCIDELNLRTIDRNKVFADDDRAVELKHFLVNTLQQEQQDALNELLLNRFVHPGRNSDRNQQDLRKSLDILHTRFKPGAFIQTVAAAVDELKYDDVINKMLARTFISDNDVKVPVQACAREGGIMAISCDPNTQTSHIPVQEGAVGGYDEGNRGFCRPEMSSPLPCSYDENNPEEGLNEPRVAGCPRGELGSAANTQDDETTLLKSFCVKESTL